jgi:hypothetical protein
MFFYLLYYYLLYNNKYDLKRFKNNIIYSIILYILFIKFTNYTNKIKNLSIFWYIILVDIFIIFKKIDTDDKKIIINKKKPHKKIIINKKKQHKKSILCHLPISLKDIQ